MDAPSLSTASTYSMSSDQMLVPTWMKPLQLASSDPLLQLLTPEALLHILHIPTLSELLYLAALAGTGVIGIAACWHASAKAELPKLFLKPSLLLMNIIKRVAALQRPYHPRPFCTHGHIETIAAALLRLPTRLPFKRQCISLPDGGSISLDWAVDPNLSTPNPHCVLPADAPILLLIPGRLTGSQDAGLQHSALLSLSYGFRPVVFNPRGSGSSPVTSPSFSSLSSAADLAEALRHIAAAYPSATIVAAGWSLGANLLIRYLGEAGSASAVRAAAALSTPFDLPTCIHSLSKGLSHLVYDRHAVAGLKSVLRASSLLWTGGPGDAAAALRASTVRDFDAAIGACSFGMGSVDSLYRELSCTAMLRSVAVPLLLVAALDDPLVPASSIPTDAIGANPCCVLLTTACGGHMGWLAGAPSLFRHTWADEVLVEFLQSAVVELANTKLQESLSPLPTTTSQAAAPTSRRTAARPTTIATTRSLDIPGSGAPAPLPRIATRVHARSASGTLIEDSPRVLHGLMPSAVPVLPLPPPTSLPPMTLSPPVPHPPSPPPPANRYFWDETSHLPLPPYLGINFPQLQVAPAPPPPHSPQPLLLARPLPFQASQISGPLPAQLAPLAPPACPVSPSPRTMLDDAFSSWDAIYDIVRRFPSTPPGSPSLLTPAISPPHRTAATTPRSILTQSDQQAHTLLTGPPAAALPCGLYGSSHNSPFAPDVFKQDVRGALAAACEQAMSGILAAKQPAPTRQPGPGVGSHDAGEGSSQDRVGVPSSQDDVEQGGSDCEGAEPHGECIAEG